MEAVNINEGQGAAKDATKKAHKRSGPRYPVYNIADSVAVADAIEKQGGGLATRDQLAAFLKYKTTNSGAFLSRIAAARLFELVDGGKGGNFTITACARKILFPVYSQQAQEGLLEAFFSVPLYHALFDEHRGRELPEDFGMRNLLRIKYGIDAGQVGSVINNFMQSAEVAGFFLTRQARTHLILPQLQKRAVEPDVSEDGPDEGGASGDDGGEGNGGGTPPQERVNREALQNEYIASLLDAFKKKLADGEMDQDLGAKIEKLVGLEP